MNKYLNKINDVLSKCIVLRYKFAEEGASSIVEKLDDIINKIEGVRSETNKNT